MNHLRMWIVALQARFYGYGVFNAFFDILDVFFDCSYSLGTFCGYK